MLEYISIYMHIFQVLSDSVSKALKLPVGGIAFKATIILRKSIISLTVSMHRLLMLTIHGITYSI